MTPVPRERAAHMYVGGATTRQVADMLGVDASTVRRWLTEAGVPLHPRGPRPRLDGDAVEAARLAGLSWSQIADAVGVSKTGARLKFLRDHAGDPGLVERAHLTAAQERELVRVWQRRPEHPGPRNLAGDHSRVSVGRGGERLRELLVRHHTAGVTWTELAAALGLSPSRVVQIVNTHG